MGGRGGRAARRSSAWSGLHRVRPELPCAPAVEVGWRLHPDHWGHGYATEAAAASLRFGFDEAGLDEIVAFTTTLNTRSQAVMERIGMVRDPAGDFDHPRLPEGSPLRRHVLYRITRVTGAPLAWRHERRRRAPKRCDWAGSDPEMVAYHDTEWGVPVHDDPTHFEFLVLEGAQAGLSWSTILKRRDGLPQGLRRLRRRQGGALHAGPGGEAAGRPGHHPQPGQGRVDGAQRPRLPGRAGGVRLVRRLHLGLRRRAAPRQQVAAHGAAARRSRAESEAVQRRPAPARLRLRRARPSATPTCRRPGWSTTTWSSCFRYARAHRRPAHEDPGAEAAHDGLLGREAVGDAASRRPARPRRSPPRRRRGRSRARRGRWRA